MPQPWQNGCRPRVRSERSMTFDVASLVRLDVATMEPYVPILPFDVLSAQLGRPPDEIVKLDANENLYGPSPRVRQALATMPYPHIYPDPESRHLRAALSDYIGLSADYLLVGHGADELIDLVMRLFILPGDVIVNCPPTFGMYRFDAAVNGARVLNVVRRSDFSLDVDAVMQAVAGESSCKLVFVTSPNNPDGGLLSADALEHLLSLPVVVVLDEAYVEFAGPGCSFIRWVPGRDNLIALRSFSKWAGLAGLRLGYGAFPPAIIQHLWKIKQPYNVNVAAQVAGIASLEDQDHLLGIVRRMIAERERMTAALRQIPYLRPYPSQANFVLCRVMDRDACQLKQALAQRGVLIRYYDSPGLTDHVRFSVGLPEHTDRLLAELRNL
jgi:histidinol-phosphate aminotransferase